MRALGTIFFVRLAVFAALAASCAPRTPRPAEDLAPLPADRVRHYTIWLGGWRVGTAIEHEAWTRTGMRLTRDERLRFLRGDAEVELATAIVVDADPKLVAQRVRWTEHGTDLRAAEAIHTVAGWQISTGGELAADAVPAELVPLLVRRDGAFAGTVFMPARGFVAGTGRIDPIAPGRLVAQLSLAAGTVVEATIDLDADGAPARIVDGEGVIAIRASEAQASEPFHAVDLIAATAIPIAGSPSHRILLEGNLALPDLPAQRAHGTPRGLEIELEPTLGAAALPPGPGVRDRTDEIRGLVTTVRARITPDLRVQSRDAAATAGDCTTFALAYAALATRRSIPTRVVTGLRVDGDRLVRHRWDVSWTGTRWIAIDAAFGAAPAGGDLIGLAVHDPDDAGLVAGEASLAQVRSATWIHEP